MTFRKSLLTVLFSAVLLLSLSARGIEHSTSMGAETAYYFDNNKGWGHVGGFAPISYSPVEDPIAVSDRVLGSGWGGAEAQFVLKHRMKIPFLQGEGAMTEGNNATINLDFNLSPVSVVGKASVTITPIAFLNFNVGGALGTGWNAVVFNGLGDNINGVISNDSFPGLYSEVFSSATFQFDLAALVPGEWNHVVTQINAKFTYKSFSSDHAKNGGPWQWLADGGENLNGWKFDMTYFLGYQMPLVLNTVGFLVETSQQLAYDVTETMDSVGGWGSDFMSVNFGPLANFQFNEHHSLAALVQIKTARDYTDGTIFNEYYQDRVYEDTYLYLNRVAFVYTYSF